MTADGSHRPGLLAEQRAFYNDAHPRLLRLLRKHTPDAHTAEDVATEVWKAFFAKWNHEPGTFYPSFPLLNRIAHCRWANWWRDHGSKMPDLYPDLDELAKVIICPDVIDDLITRMDLSRAILSALKELPARQRQAVHLHYLCDLSMSEVGDLMGITTRGARKAVNQALATLRSSSYLAIYADQIIPRPGVSP